jgi:hypothetical protein
MSTDNLYIVKHTYTDPKDWNRKKYEVAIKGTSQVAKLTRLQTNLPFLTQNSNFEGLLYNEYWTEFYKNRYQDVKR